MGHASWEWFPLLCEVPLGHAPGGSAVKAAWARCPCHMTPCPCRFVPLPLHGSAPPQRCPPYVWCLYYKAEHQEPGRPVDYQSSQRQDMVLRTWHCSCLEHCFFFVFLMVFRPEAANHVTSCCWFRVSENLNLTRAVCEECMSREFLCRTLFSHIPQNSERSSTLIVVLYSQGLPSHFVVEVFE